MPAIPPPGKQDKHPFSEVYLPFSLQKIDRVTFGIMSSEQANLDFVRQFFVSCVPNFWIFLEGIWAISFTNFFVEVVPGCRSLGRAAFDALDTCEVGNPLCRCRFVSYGNWHLHGCGFPIWVSRHSLHPPLRRHTWTPILERQRRAIAVQWVCTSGCALVVEDLRRLTGFPRLFIWGKNWKSGDEKRF